MNIGGKIKELRIEKMMTQSELSGNEITRNMLSRIENGAANPSLSTIIYIAKKLGVPAGYLLSDGDEEFTYNKTKVMKNIRKAYLDKSYEICRDMCISSFDEYDDELELILTDCCVGGAEECIKNGKLRIACELLDEALMHSDRTIYSTVTQRNRVHVLFYLLKNISPSLDSNEIDTDISEVLLTPVAFGDVFSKYASIVYNVDKNFDVKGFMFNIKEELSEYDKLYVEHLKLRQNMSCGDFKKAIVSLKSIMDGDIVPQRLMLYFCCCDMEICCRELKDYKGAYEFANNKMEILEHMLIEE